MEPNPNLNKYVKAKIEEPNLRLPKAMLKPNTDQSTGELCYMNIFEDDLKKTKHLAEEIAAGAKLDRKVYRIRHMELYKAVGDDFENMHQIHKVSKATIGLLVDPEANRNWHAFIDLVGTVEQVKMAEELILDSILRTYEGPIFPVILMPPTVYGHEITLDVDKVVYLLGDNASNALAIEVVSGAWLQIDDKPTPGRPSHERVVSIYGPKAHVFKAVSLIHSQVYAPGECLEAEDELQMLFSELSFDEVMAGMKSRTAQMVDFVGAASASSSGQTEEQKEQHDEEAKDKDEPVGEKLQKDAKDVEVIEDKDESEGEKLQKDEKDVEVTEDKDESKGEKKNQHEEDVKEGVSGKPKGPVEERD